MLPILPKFYLHTSIINRFEKFSKVQLKHEMTFGYQYLPSCSNTVKYNAALAGGFMVISGLHDLTPLPRVAHYALAGYAANQLCQGELGSSAFQWEGPAWGVGGGLAAAFLLA